MCDENSTHCNEMTTKDTESWHSDMYVLGFIMVMGPGIVLNVIALSVFGKNLSRSAHLATHLLFSLVCADILALVQATVFHMIKLKGIETKTVCGWSGFLSTLCPLLCAIVASLMAIDRCLALCKPYFYRAEVRTVHWRVIFLSLSGFSVILCTFPFLGLGEYYHETNPSNINNSSVNNQIQCGVFKRISKNNTNVFGVFYGSTGLFLVAIVLVCNCFVVRAVLKMKKTVTSVPPPDSPTFIPSEIIFAKVMGVLAVVFLICWTPYMVRMPQKFFLQPVSLSSP